MDYNNYMNEEQSVSFDYCSKLNRNFKIFGGIALSIFLIPFGAAMVYSIFLLITNPAEISDSTAERIFFIFFCIFMLVGVLIIIWGVVLKPIFKNTYNKKVFISKEGIFSQVNDNFIDWDEVKEIGIGLKGQIRAIVSYVIIQHENFIFNPRSLKSLVYDEKLISVECTQEVLDTMKQFYGDEIKNLKRYQPKAEKKYMKDAMIFSSIVLFPIAAIIIVVVFASLLG